MRITGIELSDCGWFIVWGQCEQSTGKIWFVFVGIVVFARIFDWHNNAISWLPSPNPFIFSFSLAFGCQLNLIFLFIDMLLYIFRSAGCMYALRNQFCVCLIHLKTRHKLKRLCNTLSHKIESTKKRTNIPLRKNREEIRLSLCYMSV